jgi:type I restriction enzyme S subunit
MSSKELPIGWDWALIDELISRNGIFCDGDWVESKDQNPDGEIRLIQLADIGDGKFLDKSNRFLTYEKSIQLRCTYLKRGDILIARLPEPLGRACIFPLDGDKKYVTAVDVCIVRPETNDINRKYLLFTLNSPKIRAEIEKYKSGTTRKRVSRKNLAKIKIPIASLPEQHYIVARLEELFSDLDDGIASLKKAQEQLTTYRQAVLKYAFEGKLTAEWRKQHQPESAETLLEQIKTEREQQYQSRLNEWQQTCEQAKATGKKKPPKPKKPKNLPPLTEAELAELPELPEGWCYIYLAYIGELGRGKSKHRPRNDPKLFGGKYPFVQTGEIKAAKEVLREFSQTYNEIGLQQSKLWPVGTLCITIAANIADTVFLGIEACFPDSVVGFSGYKTIINSKYVDYFIQSVKTKIEAFAPATAQKNINLATLENLLIPYCSLEEQNVIINEIESRLSVCDQLEQTIADSLQKAESLRQSILKHAFEGKLTEPWRKTHPDLISGEHSAAALLERIRTEKEKLTLKKQ